MTGRLRRFGERPLQLNGALTYASSKWVFDVGIADSVSWRITSMRLEIRISYYFSAFMLEPDCSDQGNPAFSRHCLSLLFQFSVLTARFVQKWTFFRKDEDMTSAKYLSSALCETLQNFTIKAKRGLPR